MLIVMSGVFSASAETRDYKTAEQRYEVTIAPPRRPGSENTQAVDSIDDAADAAQDQEQVPHKDAAQSPSAAHPKQSAERAARLPAAARSETPSTAASANTAEGPRMALQVGAYRQRRSAEQLKETLGASFRDVIIIDTTSGGEALYRVHVARLPKGPVLDDIKRRLLAAGYPAFEVPASDPAPR